MRLIKDIYAPSQFRVINTLRLKDCDRMSEEEIREVRNHDKRNYAGNRNDNADAGKPANRDS